ncbi:hypothetical protein TNCT_362161 [Trichonephila clavata]|uniref:Uncharacterized protein n=1 Tax=Trichonephila clavata TaxID=2740835 RepID=A0A8X6HTQ3_TRICU|nr:hypothetical protein TNCT_362161 [Trichonephila clavata]
MQGKNNIDDTLFLESIKINSTNKQTANFALKQQPAVSRILFLARKILRYEDTIERGKNAFLLQTAISKPTFQKKPGGFELFITPNEGITSKIPSAHWAKWMVSPPSGSNRPKKKKSTLFRSICSLY